jgi:hypothetical protein
LRSYPSEGSIEKNLASSRFQEILPPDNLSDLHGMIVGHDRQLIGRDIVTTPNDKISEIHSCGKRLFSLANIMKTNVFSVRNPEPPVYAAWCCSLASGSDLRTPFGRENWFDVILGMGR